MISVMITIISGFSNLILQKYNDKYLYKNKYNISEMRKLSGEGKHWENLFFRMVVVTMIQLVWFISYSY